MNDDDEKIDFAIDAGFKDDEKLTVHCEEKQASHPVKYHMEYEENEVEWKLKEFGDY